jgi:hypothetical protein
LVEHFTSRVVQPYLLTNNLKKALIIMDQATCHKKAQFLESLQKLNCEVIFIPARLTGILYD